jgi:hypothetical protein
VSLLSSPRRAEGGCDFSARVAFSASVTATPPERSSRPRGRLDFGAWFTVKDKPNVVAKSLIAVLRWDEASTVGGIPVPTRIITGGADRITLRRAAEHMQRATRTRTWCGSHPRGTPASSRKGTNTPTPSR